MKKAEYTVSVALYLVERHIVAVARKHHMEGVAIFLAETMRGEKTPEIEHPADLRRAVEEYAAIAAKIARKLVTVSETPTSAWRSKTEKTIRDVIESLADAPRHLAPSPLDKPSLTEAVPAILELIPAATSVFVKERIIGTAARRSTAKLLAMRDRFSAEPSQNPRNAAEIANLLLRLSKTQRRKLAAILENEKR
jgi:hypothetical protein